MPAHTNPLPPISIRPAVAGDALCLGVLATQVFLDTYARDGVSPAHANEALSQHSVEAYAAQLADARRLLLVAERAGHLVGFALLELDVAHAPEVDAPATELRRLYVQEPFTGRGLGRDLLRAAEDAAATRGARTLWLTAWEGNARALAFYPRQGYADVGRTVYTIDGVDYPNHLFARTLAPVPQEGPA